MSIPSMSWRLRAACATADPALFFRAEGDTPHGALVREATAKAICATCPVRRQCGQFAVVNGIPWGTWGGMTEDERARVRRNYLRRQHGYERKAA